MKAAIIIVTVAFMLPACSTPPVPPNDAPAKTVDTKIRFSDATGTSGVTFRHVPTRTDEKWMPETMGSGVVAADFNRDGAPDIVLVNSGAVWQSSRPAEAGNRLFLNDGRGKFTDNTQVWKLP